MDQQKYVQKSCSNQWRHRSFRKYFEKFKVQEFLTQLQSHNCESQNI